MIGSGVDLEWSRISSEIGNGKWYNKPRDERLGDIILLKERIVRDLEMIKLMTDLVQAMEKSL